jgi:hypothetical protein
LRLALAATSRVPDKRSLHEQPTADSLAAHPSHPRCVKNCTVRKPHRLAGSSHGRGWFRTSDLSRVKRDRGAQSLLRPTGCGHRAPANARVSSGPRAPGLSAAGAKMFNLGSTAFGAAWASSLRASGRGWAMLVTPASRPFRASRESAGRRLRSREAVAQTSGEAMCAHVPSLRSGWPGAGCLKSAAPVRLGRA